MLSFEFLRDFLPARLARSSLAASRTTAGGILTLIATVAVLVAGCSPKPESGRTIVLGIDSLDPVVIDLLLSEGKLPNFAKLRQRGAYGHLESMRPILSPIIWTTIATGRPPIEHGIGHFVTANEATGKQLPVTSPMRKVSALWNMLSGANKEVAVVGWWATWPAEQVRGTIVSDHACYHFLFDEGAAGASDPIGLVYPPADGAELLAMVRRPGDMTMEDLRPYIDIPPEELSREFRFDDDVAHFRWALASAHSYSDMGEHLWRTRRPDLLMVYIEGVDSTSHLFGHLFRAENLAGELAQQQRRYGSAVEKMYELADEIVGRYLALMDSETTLVVLSDHGFQLGELHGDPSKTRDMRRVSERFHRIDGVLYLYGRGIKAGARIDGAGLLDVTPTLLALAGMPAAADMPGRILNEALLIDAPAPRIASYGPSGSHPQSASAENETTPVDTAILEKLRGLGYLDTASPTGDRNLAAMQFEAGKYKEAADAYRKLLVATPDDSALHASLAGALGALGDYDGALAQLAEAEKLDPLNPEIYHNRGVVLERQKRAGEAIEQYRRAARYSPDYKPSRAALERLTGSPDAIVPRTDAERRATAMAEQASISARRGDHASAMQQLDEAEAIAPAYVLIYQYRANIAFLMKDHPRAIQALRKALELEPDNALYARNLARLEQERSETNETQPPGR